MSVKVSEFESMLLPSTVDSLLGMGEDRWSSACIGWCRGDWYPRIRGFRDAAELLERQVAETGRSKDVLIYPFLANWRQHIELALKALIRELEQLLDRSAKQRITHKLDDLWSSCRSLLTERYGDNDLYEHAARVIGELHRIDPRAGEFRYPFTTNGDVALARIEDLSFDKVSAALRPLSDFLEIASTMVSVDLDAKHDMYLLDAAG